MTTIISGKFWYGGDRKNEFDLDRVVLNSYKDLKLILNKNQGAIFKTSNQYIIKKEAGAWNFYIKTKNSKWHKIRTFKTLNKIFDLDLTKYLKDLTNSFSKEEDQAYAWIEAYRPVIAEKYKMSEKEVERIYQPYFFRAWDIA